MLTNHGAVVVAQLGLRGLQHPLRLAVRARLAEVDLDPRSVRPPDDLLAGGGLNGARHLRCGNCLRVGDSDASCRSSQTQTKQQAFRESVDTVADAHVTPAIPGPIQA